MEKSPHSEKGIQPVSVLKSSSTSLSPPMDYECSTGQYTPKLNVGGLKLNIISEAGSSPSFPICDLP